MSRLHAPNINGDWFLASLSLVRPPHRFTLWFSVAPEVRLLWPDRRCTVSRRRTSSFARRVRSTRYRRLVCYPESDRCSTTFSERATGSARCTRSKRTAASDSDASIAKTSPVVLPFSSPIRTPSKSSSKRKCRRRASRPCWRGSSRAPTWVSAQDY